MTKVAVYGSLRQGMGNHRLLEESEFLGTTTTMENYTMFSLGGFPRVALDVLGETPVVVEVYNVNDATLERLNWLEGHRGKRDPSNFYDVSLVETVDFGPVYMYHINGDGSEDAVVSGGDWVEYRKTNTGSRLRLNW